MNPVTEALEIMFSPENFRDRWASLGARKQPRSGVANITLSVYGNRLSGIAKYKVIGEDITVEELVLEVPTMRGTDWAQLTIDAGELDEREYRQIEIECEEQDR